MGTGVLKAYQQSRLLTVLRMVWTLTSQVPTHINISYMIKESKSTLMAQYTSDDKSKFILK